MFLDCDIHFIDKGLGEGNGHVTGLFFAHLIASNVLCLMSMLPITDASKIRFINLPVNHGYMKYVSISIPGELIVNVDKVIEKKVRGYSSRAEFVKDAIRRLLEDIAKDGAKK